MWPSDLNFFVCSHTEVPEKFVITIVVFQSDSRIYMVMPNAMKCNEMHITEGAVQE